jgi:hypothetical protein
MDFEWLGLAWSVTGIHGACDGRAPTLRWACEVPVLPRSLVSRACAGQTRPQRPEDPGVARIAVAATPDRDAIAAYDQPCILDGSCGDPAPGGLGRSARRLPSGCEKAEQLVRLGRRLAGGRYRMTAWPRGERASPRTYGIEVGRS